MPHCLAPPHAPIPGLMNVPVLTQIPRPLEGPLTTRPDRVAVEVDKTEASVLISNLQAYAEHARCRLVREELGVER
jgi:hypothetical protein